MTFTIALFGLIGALAGTLPPILAFLRTRDASATRRHDLEAALTEVQFLNEWLNISGKLVGDAELTERQDKARHRLDALMTRVELLEAAPLATAPQQPVPRTSRSEGIDDAEAPREASPTAPGRPVRFPFISSGLFFMTTLGASVNPDQQLSLDHLIHEVTVTEGGYAFVVIAVFWLAMMGRYFWAKR